MGVISFRNTSDSIEHYTQALEFISILQDITSNPEASKNIKEVSIALCVAKELSESKKKEAADAEEIIARSNEFLEEFEAKKKNQAIKVAAELNDIQNKNIAHQAMVDEFIKSKMATLKTLDDSRKVSESKLLLAQNIQSDAKAKSAKIDQMLLDISQREADHKASMTAFEKEKKIHAEEVEKVIQEHTTNVNNLNLDRTEFELRKKRFNDVLKEANPG